MSDVNAIKSYLDFAGLSNLRAKAKDDQTSAAKEVGRQFEAMFVQMMMKSIRQANESIKSDLMGSSAVDTFEEMYHNELSQVMANNDAFGISDWLVGMLIISQLKLQRQVNLMGKNRLVSS